MKAGVASEKGVVVADIPAPRPKANEVLVKVKAAALNRADLTTARGLPHGPGGGIGNAIGIEWAGEVIETGPDVKDIWPGERVMCSGNGGYAEYAVSDWGRVMPMPDGMSFEEAATLPVSLITLHNALITAGRMQPGDSVLIQGASSGVGLMGLQIAKLMGAKLGDRHLHQSRSAARAAQGVRRRSRDRHRAIRPGPIRCSRRPTARASTSWSTCCPGPLVNPLMRATAHARPDRQCRPARRHQGGFRLRPACACGASNISA